MTCGIYKLNFTGTEKIYIGQSNNIEFRYSQHQSKFRCGTASKSLTAAYYLYGMPTYEVLVECSESELDDYENGAIEVYDAIINGFNTCSMSGTRTSLEGEKNPASKYTNNQLLEVFNLLVSTDLSQPQIAEVSGVSKQVVNHLSNGHKYLWLEEVYPEKYAVLKVKRGTRKSGSKSAKERGIIYPKIVSPEGVVYEVDNTSEFSRVHSLDSGHLGKLLNYKANSHKGWRRVEAA